MTIVSGRASEIERTLPPEQWAAAVSDLDAGSKQYLRERYRLIMSRRRLARRSDPVTSHMAADRVMASGSRDQHMGMIAHAVRTHPGCTSAELAKITGLERHEAARRTTDARTAHLIRNRLGADGKPYKRKCGVSGRPAIVWMPPLSEAQKTCLRGSQA